MRLARQRGTLSTDNSNQTVPQSDNAAKRAIKRAGRKKLRDTVAKLKGDKQRRRIAQMLSQPQDSSKIAQDCITWPARICYTARSVWDSRIPLKILERYDAVECQVDGYDSAIRKLSTSVRDESAAQKQAFSMCRITDPAHPAYQECGLFANKHIPPRTFVLEYAGFVSLNKETSSTSDYTMQIDEELSIDAERIGNEARFINDFRGIAPRANVELRLEKAPFPKMTLWTNSEPVLCGTELLLSYGKGFWRERSKAKIDS